jgi:hypothetical protein
MRVRQVLERLGGEHFDPSWELLDEEWLDNEGNLVDEE